jgi:hypothetical protein
MLVDAVLVALVAEFHVADALFAVVGRAVASVFPTASAGSSWS